MQSVGFFSQIENFIKRLFSYVSNIFDWVSKRAISVFMFFALIVFSIYLGEVIYNVTFASDELTGCQCIQHGNTTILTGLRSWRLDPIMGSYVNLNDCIDAAQKMNCELK